MEILTKCYSGNTWTEFYDDQNIPNLWYRWTNGNCQCIVKKRNRLKKEET
jgi:hypothetical protein